MAKCSNIIYADHLQFNNSYESGRCMGRQLIASMYPRKAEENKERKAFTDSVPFVEYFTLIDGYFYLNIKSSLKSTVKTTLNSIKVNDQNDSVELWKDKHQREEMQGDLFRISIDQYNNIERITCLRQSVRTVIFSEVFF